MAAKPRVSIENCPCGSRRGYASCCGALHDGEAAVSPEALMRSRYAAFVLGLERYLIDTWHSSTRPAALNLSAEHPPRKWLGLDVRRASSEGDAGIVEFVARFRPGGGPAVRMHERSRFVREGGRWYYVDGVQL